MAYVHGFAQSLTLYSSRVRELLSSWSTSKQQEHLIEIISEHLEPPTASAEKRHTPQELAQEALHQIQAVTNWFATGKNADSFRRNALTEVDKVVRRASALAATVRPNTNYATNLNTLAHQLLQAKDGETAQQIFSLAFAHLLPVHLPESFAGSPSAAYDAEQLSAWQESPKVTLYLRPVSRTNRGEPYVEDLIIDNHTILRDLVAQHKAKLSERRLHFTHLFADTYLDLGTLSHITAEDRSMLTEIIDACLGDPSYQYQAPDGSTLLLLNPEEQTYTILQASDGMLFLPRYRLQRQVSEEREEMLKEDWFA